MSSDACGSQGKNTGVDSRGDFDRLSGKQNLHGGPSSAKQAKASIRLPIGTDPASSLGNVAKYPATNLNGEVSDCMGSPVVGKEVAASLAAQNKNLTKGQSPLFSAS